MTDIVVETGRQRRLERPATHGQPRATRYRRDPSPALARSARSRPQLRRGRLGNFFTRRASRSASSPLVAPYRLSSAAGRTALTRV